MKMLKDGLWSKFKFEQGPGLTKKRTVAENTGDRDGQSGMAYVEKAGRSEHQEFVDILLMTALLAKKLCSSDNEFEIYEQFVFHNMDGAMEQQNLNKQNA